MHIKDHTNWDAADFTKQLRGRYGDRVKENQILKDYSAYRTGGPARLFLEATKAEELSHLIKLINERDIPVFMLGGGSNILVSDKGFNGFVIKNSIKGIRVENSLLYSGSGEELKDLINFSAEAGLTGLEFATGIWGTVGGAIFGNAGAYGGEIQNCLKEVELVDRHGNIIIRPAEEIEFAYRWSIFKENGEYITSAKFALKKGKKDAIRARIDEIMSIRNDKLPNDALSAGCVFKNIPDPKEKYGKIAAGKLLEDSDSKNLKFGHARVSEKHANIIVNEGGATSDDIKKLADLLKNNVFIKFGIELQEEIILLGLFE